MPFSRLLTALKSPGVDSAQLPVVSTGIAWSPPNDGIRMEGLDKPPIVGQSEQLRRVGDGVYERLIVTHNRMTGQQAGVVVAETSDYQGSLQAIIETDSRLKKSFGGLSGFRNGTEFEKNSVLQTLKRGMTQRPARFDA